MRHSLVYTTHIISLLGIRGRAHLTHSFIPAPDNLASTELELERLASLARRVEFLSVGQRSNVMDFDSLPLLGGGAI